MLTRFIDGGAAPGNTDPLATRRVRAINVATLSMIVFAIPFVFVNWITVSPLSGMLLVALQVYCLGVLLLLRWTQDVTFAGHAGTAGFFAYLVAANVLAGGFYQPGICWLLLIPLTGALLVDIRGGWVWTAGVAAALAAMWAGVELGLQPASQIPHHMRPGYYLASLLASVVAVGVLASSFTMAQRQLEGVLQRTNEAIAHMAYHDSLTGLPNRQLFRNCLDEALQRSQYTGRRVALLFVDLDDFKAVNDRLGHSAGDGLLKEVSRRFSSALRMSDALSHVDEETQAPVSRLGGDEFTVLLSELSSVDGAAVVARRLLATLNEPMVVEGNALSVSASIGVALTPEDGLDADTLLRSADAAMYEAKGRARNHFEFAPGSRREATRLLSPGEPTRGPALET